VRELQTHAVQRSNRIVYKVNKKLCQSERGGSSAMALIRRQGDPAIAKYWHEM
jgi:hypothetical protein